MCMGLEEPLSRPFAGRGAFAVSPVRAPLTAPTPLTRFAGTGASSPLAALPPAVVVAAGDWGVVVLPSPRRMAGGTPAPTSSRTATTYGQRRLRRGWAVGGGDEPA